VKRLMGEFGRMGVTYGYVVDDFQRSYRVDPERAYAALNYIVQGTAAQVLKRAVLRLQDWLGNRPARIVNLVHDEIIFEMDADFWKQNRGLIVTDITEIMTDDVNFRLALPVEVSWTNSNWAEKKKWESD